VSAAMLLHANDPPLIVAAISGAAGTTVLQAIFLPFIRSVR
jgi:hypothetical protein